MVKPINFISISRETVSKLNDLGVILLIFSFAMPIRLMAMFVLAFMVVNALKAYLGRAYLREIPITPGQQSVGLAFALFFVVYGLSLLWSYDFDYGVSRLENRSNFITMPLAFILFRVQIKNLTLILRSIIWSATLAMVGCFAVAFVYAYSYNDLQTPFKYYNFGFWLGFHPGYLSLLLVLSLLSILELAKLKHGFNWLLALTALFQTFSIVFIGARVAIVLLFIITILAAYDLLKAKKTRVALKWLIPTGIVVVTITVVALLTSSNASERILNSKESLKARFEIYSTAFDLILERPLLGYGMGGDREVLIVEYERRGMYDEAEKRYNAHNQFLQTLLEAGILGLAALGILLFTVIKHSRNKKMIWRTYLIFGSFFLIESGLQRLQGIIPFVALSLIFCFMAENSSTQKGIDKSNS